VSAIVIVNDGIKISSLSFEGEGYQIMIPENSSFWKLPADQKIDALQKAREAGIYVEDIECINNWFDNFPNGIEKDGEIKAFFERISGNEVTVLHRVANNPFISEQIKAEISDLFEKYKDILAAEHLKRAPDRNLRSEIIERDFFSCRYCGRQLEKSEIHIDHIVPYSLGGKTEIDNLAVACFTCNIKKAGRTPEAAGMLLLPLEEPRK